MQKTDGLTFLILVDVKSQTVTGCEGNSKGKFELCQDCQIRKTCLVRLNYKFNQEEEAE